MYKLVSKLLVYKDLGSDCILYKMADIIKKADKGDYDADDIIDQIYTQINRLLDVATQYGFTKNLWKCYLAYKLAMCESPFALVCEKNGPIEGSVNEFAKNDLIIFKALFNYDFSSLESTLGINCFTVISDYRAVGKSDHIYNKSVSEKVRLLADQFDKASGIDDLYEVVTTFYRDYGVGKLGLNKAFRIKDQYVPEVGSTSSAYAYNESINRSGDEPQSGRDSQGSVLVPVTSVGTMSLDDLIGYDIQKQKLIENTESFIQGKPCNNVLLYGDAGTGKSTSVKAILNKYYADGLRMIEVYKHQFKYLNSIINEIKNRNYKFIIFMDDLSFEEFEIEYKYLKAVIEGGLEVKPDNVLIYATSNRRHLIRETWSDRSDMSQDEVHRSDTMQEKLSLVARFGVTIGYFKPGVQEFYDIVERLAERHPEITMPKEEIDAEANKWEISHGGLSGRTAQQFVNYLAGKYGR
ncbi:MAG: ATP-binding protein [Lachnospiraceae bacterium]|jgi:predicted AAA+ superfamily ATPase|nr:ATP-binding protein [Lachnospiraceae bacterium]MEE3461538.1 ATP-binding protein [Lachnospiraceae bacterium]